MAFTRISQLTRDPNTNSIANGQGLIKEGHSFFYLEDVQKVLHQVNNPDAVKLSQLAIIPVKFEKSDGEGNHNIHEVTGLALAKSDIQRDDMENITNTEWHEIVALAWPPYYKAASTQLINEDPDSPFEGYPFDGDDSYVPGLEIHK